ncbi:hypothetical protein [Microbacterium sp. zg.Y909]|uniref:hypothetical protein n=1 Tax=Microbacterium sp. zg.Y909 TaxID=2969413 RepID=UPI00214B2A74|nr:hypothetical protein [Microbacterium sp. zg.Y909]MCR2826919.1 hypothetical protein [Microbacterium sp. zg.Y909]
MSHDNRTPAWILLTVALLAAVAVWSPLMGTGVGMAFVAGACTVGILFVSKSTADLAPIPGAIVPLALTGLVLIALFACSIAGTVIGLTWVSWVAAAVAGFVVACGLFVADRRSAAGGPAA